MGVERKELVGRDLGSDFSRKNNFSMYHGHPVPGFPRHPHRGFETVTVVREGLIDHADSAGATARYGGGDAQWITTGAGVCHSEMFPLVSETSPNTLDLFQIWLNLPAAKKMSRPWFSMAWSEDQPNVSFGVAPVQAHLRLVGGRLAGLVGPAPPPDSWAAVPENEVVIAVIRQVGAAAV